MQQWKYKYNAQSRSPSQPIPLPPPVISTDPPAHLECQTGGSGVKVDAGNGVAGLSEWEGEWVGGSVSEWEGEWVGGE